MVLLFHVIFRSALPSCPSMLQTTAVCLFLPCRQHRLKRAGRPARHTIPVKSGTGTGAVQAERYDYKENTDVVEHRRGVWRSERQRLSPECPSNLTAAVHPGDIAVLPCAGGSTLYSSGMESCTLLSILKNEEEQYCCTTCNELLFCRHYSYYCCASNRLLLCWTSFKSPKQRSIR